MPSSVKLRTQLHLSNPATRDEAKQQCEDYRPDDGDNDGINEAARPCKAKVRHDESAQHRPQNADDDIHERAISSATHDFTCEPTCNEPYDNPPNQSEHSFLPLSCYWNVVPRGRSKAAQISAYPRPIRGTLHTQSCNCFQLISRRHPCQENLRAESYNLVGFQNHLKYGEQARILRLIPGLESAKFLRYGQIHRNTYIDGPTLLRETLQMKEHSNVLFAGQISGVEGYVESIATGLLAGMYAAALATKARPIAPPRATAFGALVNYICHADAKNFQPANITFDLLLPLDDEMRHRIRDKKQRHTLVCQRALSELQSWLEANRMSESDANQSGGRNRPYSRIESTG